jgi:uncharacterized protein YukE
MTGTLRVDIPALRACGPSFAHLSTLVDEALRRLGDRLDAQGPCWGGDEAGAAFQAAYGPAADTVRRILPDLRDGVASVGLSLRVAADTAEAAEDRTANRFG